MANINQTTRQCSTWNIFPRDAEKQSLPAEAAQKRTLRLMTRTDREDSPFLVTRHTVNGHMAGQEGAFCFRVVHLTDLHLHPDYPLEKLRRLAALVNAQEPDLIVFTGDFLRHSGMQPLPREGTGGTGSGGKPGRTHRKAVGGPLTQPGRTPGAARGGPLAQPGGALGSRLCPEGLRRAARLCLPVPSNSPPEALAILRGMKARYGKYAVRGNHDLRGNPRQVPFYLKKAGFTLLCNERAVIELTAGRCSAFDCETTSGRKGLECGCKRSSAASQQSVPPHAHRLVIAGLDDGAYHLTDPRAVQPLKQEQGFRLVLAHEPMLARLIPAGAAELVLAGHTHAGQFRLGGTQRLWMPRLTDGNFRGWRAVNGNPLYVSAGLGESGFGLRILCPAELPVFDCWVG